MGKQLSKYFGEANKIGGMKAMMRLSVISKISGSKANSEPDSPENIKRLEAALLELKKEFK